MTFFLYWLRFIICPIKSVFEVKTQSLYYISPEIMDIYHIYI